MSIPKITIPNNLQNNVPISADIFTENAGSSFGENITVPLIGTDVNKGIGAIDNVFKGLQFLNASVFGKGFYRYTTIGQSIKTPASILNDLGIPNDLASYMLQTKNIAGDLLNPIKIKCITLGGGGSGGVACELHYNFGYFYQNGSNGNIGNDTTITLGGNVITSKGGGGGLGGQWNGNPQGFTITKNLYELAIWLPLRSVKSEAGIFGYSCNSGGIYTDLIRSQVTYRPPAPESVPIGIQAYGGGGGAVGGMYLYAGTDTVEARIGLPAYGGSASTPKIDEIIITNISTNININIGSGGTAIPTSYVFYNYPGVGTYYIDRPASGAGQQGCVMLWI